MPVVLFLKKRLSFVLLKKKLISIVNTAKMSFMFECYHRLSRRKYSFSLSLELNQLEVKSEDPLFML